MDFSRMAWPIRGSPDREGHPQDHRRAQEALRGPGVLAGPEPVKQVAAQLANRPGQGLLQESSVVDVRLHGGEHRIRDGEQLARLDRRQSAISNSPR
jgi:hypothetical protein